MKPAKRKKRNPFGRSRATLQKQARLVEAREGVIRGAADVAFNLASLRPPEGAYETLWHWKGKAQAAGATEAQLKKWEAEGTALGQQTAQRRAKKNPGYLGRHGLAHKEHPMLGLSKEQVRSTREHLQKLQEARKAGYKGSYTTDPQWLVEQAINRRGGFVDDPDYRGSAIPVRGKFAKKGGGALAAEAWRLAHAINTPRLRVYESQLGSWKGELKKRLPKRFSRYGEDE